MDFYDSTQPEKIPAGSHALLYYDGDYMADLAAAKRFAAVRWITVLGNFVNCGAADFEPGNAVFSKAGALRKFVIGRQEMGCLARVYTDLSNAAAAHAQVGDLPNVRWWVAAYGPKMTAAQVVAAMKAHGAAVAEADVWGLQYEGGVKADYDTSVLYGTW
jgi:hypothetical protein